MLETLKARKEQLEARGKKGFTLMEMLIVIAIIAILIAIAIPLFTSQLNNAKIAADEANARSVYAVIMADYMDNNKIDATITNNVTDGGTNSNVTITNGSDSQKFDFSDQTSKLEINQTGTPSVTIEFKDASRNQTFGGSASTGTGA